MRDCLAWIKLPLDALDRSHDELRDLVLRVFELSQTLPQVCYGANRQIVEVVCFNYTRDGVTLCPTNKKSRSTFRSNGLI